MKKIVPVLVLLALLLAGCGGTPASQATSTNEVPAVPDLLGMNGAEAQGALRQAVVSYDFYLNGQKAQILGKDLVDYYVVATKPQAGEHPAFGTVTEVDLAPVVPAITATQTPAGTPASTTKAPPPPSPTQTPQPPVQTPPQEVVITYVVESDAPTTIGYTNIVDGEMSEEQASDTGPGSTAKEYRFPTYKFGGRYSVWGLGVTATGGDGSTFVTCHILVNGREILKKTSTGAYTMVVCNKSGTGSPG